MLFTEEGITKGFVLNRRCMSCKANHFCSHAELNGTMKTYPYFNKLQYFISSSQTVYSMKLLKQFERYFVTSVGNFHDFEDLYQETFVNGYA